MKNTPWTEEQIKELNDFQQSGKFHPYTCISHHNGQESILIATKNGWICPHCDYTQNWAH